MKKCPFRCRAVVSLRFEPFLALWSMFSSKAKRHRDWVHQAQGRLKPSTRNALHRFENCASAWPILADLAGTLPPACTIEHIVHTMTKREPTAFAGDFLAHAFHDARLAEEIAQHRADIREAIAILPAEKREWLAHIGLYPYEPSRPMVRLVEQLVRDPKSVQQEASRALQGFWNDVFADAWATMSGQMAASRAKAEEILFGGSWGHLGHRLGLNVEVDLGDRELRALRGGYRLGFADIEHADFMPSAFNEQAFWTVHSGKQGALVYFPYFDPSLSPSGDVAIDRRPAAAAPDVALAFRALGDATRFAIASLIAKRAMSASEIGRQLGLSRASVTHHLHALRQAGLVDETQKGTTLSLSLSRSAIARLSDLALESLFDSIDSGQLLRSRRQP